ncbi:MAG: hypothetical protein JO264_17250 [Acidisphaera sp.]|nr:hypothetical protein [Acidisphaera sp.]
MNPSFTASPELLETSRLRVGMDTLPAAREPAAVADTGRVSIGAGMRSLPVRSA